jgi:hypothetical protein
MWFSGALEANVSEIEKHYEAIHRRIKYNSMIIRRQLLDMNYWNDDLLEENQELVKQVKELFGKLCELKGYRIGVV